MTNPLYYIVQNSDFKSLPDEIQGITRKFGKYQDTKPYALINLPLHKESISNLLLTGHHITIFENDIFYHYTAYLENEVGEKFRVHVYFSPDDEIDGDPIFDLQISETDYKHQKNSKYDQAFTQQAREVCEPVIGFLRARQDALLKKHKKQLRKLDKQAEDLSENLMQNKEAYLKVSEFQLNEMLHIQRYSDDPLPILGRIELLHSLRDSIHQLEMAPIEAVEEVEEPNTDSPLKPVELAFFDKPRLHKGSKQGSSESFFLKRVHEMKAFVSKCERPVELTTLYKEAQVLEFRYDLEVQDKKSEVRDEIKKLKMELMKAGTNEVKRCIKEKNVEELKLLRPFFSCITEQNLYSALANNDSKLLDFFLRSELFTAEHHSFEMNGVKYASLVDYCFKQHKKEKPLVECFEVLIKHGASLLGTSSVDKLPNAALILLDSEHPFKAPFDRHFKLTAKHSKFYEQLNEMLEQWVKAKCSKEQIEKVKLIIKNHKFYKSTFEEIHLKLKEMTSSETDRQKKRIMQASEKHVLNFTEKMIDLAKEHEKSNPKDSKELQKQTIQEDTMKAVFGLFSDLISETAPTLKQKTKLRKHSHESDTPLRFNKSQ